MAEYTPKEMWLFSNGDLDEDVRNAISKEIRWNDQLKREVNNLSSWTEEQIDGFYDDFEKVRKVFFDSFEARCRAAEDRQHNIKEVFDFLKTPAFYKALILGEFSENEVNAIKYTLNQYFNDKVKDKKILFQVKIADIKANTKKKYYDFVDRVFNNDR